MLLVDPVPLLETPPPVVPCATVAPAVDVVAVVPADGEALLSDDVAIALLLFSFSTVPPDNDAAGVVVLLELGPPTDFSL